MTRRPRPNLPPSIHPIEPVSSQPVSVMTDWRIFQLRGPTNLRSRHLVGRADGEGRVCSALARLDLTTLTTLTAVSGSGRFYRLEGPPGQNPDATYVWEQWTRLNRATHMRDMTRALLRLRRLRGLHDLPEAAPPAEPWGPLE